MNYKHCCPEWDFMEIDDTMDEFEACLCEIDSDGRGPEYHAGDRVYLIPTKTEATIIKQIKHFDGWETFWGNVILECDDGSKIEANCWQCRRIE
jgi:hypothetical protein